jgi:hypothetical protein
MSGCFLIALSYRRKFSGGGRFLARQGLFDLIDQHQAQLARLERGERVSMALNSPWISSTCRVRVAPSRPFAQQAQHFAVGAAALAGVLVEQHLVEGAPRIAVCSRMSSSRRSPAPLITTTRRVAGRRRRG